MKKVVLSLAIVAAMFVSCKENAAETTETVDSTVVETPVEEAAPVADTTAVDSTTAPAAPEAAPAK
jgi:hypothetical protein